MAIEGNFERCDHLTGGLFSFLSFLHYVVKFFLALALLYGTTAESSSHVPSLDGQARSWRRYTKEVAWYVSSTPTQKRRYVASRLIGKLSGPARLLAMSWNRNEFDSQDGTLRLLQKLAASPLVRRTLPNTAAIMQQYLGFRRRPGENMSTFLVRETLGYEEFSEALTRLWEEQAGIDPSAMDFGLPPLVEEAWDGWSHWYGSSSWDATSTPAPPAEEVHGDDSGEVRGEAEASPGSAPSGREAGPRPTPSLASASIQADGHLVNETSLADSFIMQVLRGWRLLQAASLSAEETRDILSTTQNKLTFEAISQALQTLWDDQLLGHRYRPAWQQANALWSEGEDEWSDGWYGDAQWDYDDFTMDYQDDYWSEWPEDVPVEPADTAEADEKVLEAQKAEQVAEQLALEARKTWVEAQRNAQQVRKDRGFGQSLLGVKCFNCGGNHYARDCPDRRHGSIPSMKGSGKGKTKSSFFLDPHSMYQLKGKNAKGKGKSKQSLYADGSSEAFWLARGKGKGKTSSFERPSVNAYAMNYGMDLAGMELAVVSQKGTAVSPESLLASESQPSVFSKAEGMLDCGATASAAPDIAVQGLIQAVLSQDAGARIEVEYSRPFFRFGNGKWGQALYRVNLSSHVSGQQRRFSLYSLPNPSR